MYFCLFIYDLVKFGFIGVNFPGHPLFFRIPSLALAITAFYSFLKNKERAHWFFVSWVFLSAFYVIYRLGFIFGFEARGGNYLQPLLVILILYFSHRFYLDNFLNYQNDRELGFLDRLAAKRFIWPIFYLMVAILAFSALSIFLRGGDFLWILGILAYFFLIFYLIRGRRLLALIFIVFLLLRFGMLVPYFNILFYPLFIFLGIVVYRKFLLESIQENLQK